MSVQFDGRTLRLPLGLLVIFLAQHFWIAGALAQELEPSVNSAFIIDFPTALDQVTPNFVHSTFEAYDLAAPDLRPAEVGYGRQMGVVQLTADAYWRPQVRSFDYAEAKAKIRTINIDAQRTYIAFGAIARWTDQTSKDDVAIDNKPYSLLGVVTTELYPFDSWGAFLLNFYLDNRFADVGLKVQIYDTIKFLAETDYHHGDVNDLKNKWRSKAGVQFDGDKNFYMQVLYDDAGNHIRLQLGGGF